MATTLDLDAYFARIGFGDPTRVDLQTLGGLLAAHMRAIPFENLDVLLGRGVRVDLESIEGKLVRARRGGYCFEHATLLHAVLERLGFRPARHSARVTIFLPVEQAPRTHMFLTVPLAEGTFVVDPGFGSLAPRVPVPLAEGVEARAAHESHAMVRDGQRWVLRATQDGKTVSAWTSTVEEDRPVDFEMADHYTSTFPSSAFVNRLMMRALTDDGRVSVMNRDVKVTRGAASETTQLESRRELRDLLAERFGIDLPEVETLRVPSVPEWA